MRSIVAAAFGFTPTLASGAVFAGFENPMEFYEAATALPTSGSPRRGHRG